MNLTIKQVHDILQQYFPEHQWEDFEEAGLRIALAERALPMSYEKEFDNDGQCILYTSIVDSEE